MMLWKKALGADFEKLNVAELQKERDVRDDPKSKLGLLSLGMVIHVSTRTFGTTANGTLGKGRMTFPRIQ